MRKWVVMTLIGGLALIPALAFADVDIDVDIHKDKRKIVREAVVKLKAALIVAVVTLRSDKAAESETLVNQTNHNNHESDSRNGSGSAISSVGGTGITNVNQASGNMNNQANAVSVAVDPDSQSTSRTGSFAESQAASDQKNTNNRTFSSTSISQSILGTVSGSGIIGVNQASGHMNNQANAVSVAVGVGPAGIALSEADLGQVNSWNRACSSGSTSLASIGSVTGNGITGVNQSSGNMNNQSNVVSVAAVR